MHDGDVVAIIGGAETTPGTRPPSVRRAYGGFGCSSCGLICGWVDNDGRCQSCGPLPIASPEMSEHDAALQREREIAEQIRNDRR